MMDPRKVLAGGLLLAGATVLAGCSVKVGRPELPAPRMIDPPLAQYEPVPTASGAHGFRLLWVEAADPIRYRLLHRSPDGEVRQDPVWSWSRLPSRLLETTLMAAVSSEPGLVLVDGPNAPTVALTLLGWHLEGPDGARRLVGIVEVQLTDEQRRVHSTVLESGSPVQGDLPGDLASVAATVLGDLAAQVLATVRSGA